MDRPILCGHGQPYSYRGSFTAWPVLPWSSWNVLWRFWPLLLIGAGIDILIGRRSAVGAIVSAVVPLILVGGVVVVILFAQNIPTLAQFLQPVELHTEHVEYPPEGVARASVHIDWTSALGYLSALRDLPNLIKAEIIHRRQVLFDVRQRGDSPDVKLDSRSSGPWLDIWRSEDREKERWEVGLSPDVPLSLTLDSGSGPCDFDLTGLQVTNLSLDGGSGPITVGLPRSVAGRVVLDAGSGSFTPDGRFRLVEGGRRGDGMWETGNFGTVERAIVLRIDQGSGPISIR